MACSKLCCERPIFVCYIDVSKHLVGKQGTLRAFCKKNMQSILTTI